MSYSPSFSAAQSAAAPATVVFTDDSTGADAAIVGRRIYVTDNQGNAVVPSGTSTSYIDWPLADNPLTVANLLPNDLACNVDVQWLDVSDGVLYELDEDYPFVENNKQFYFYLLQQLALYPSTLQDTNYLSNLEQYWAFITGGINAISIGNDISNSQNLINMATEMLQNETKYF